jgi:uncharacterized protein (DUF1501 family)
MPMNAHRACDDFHRTAGAARGGLTRREVIGRGMMAGLAVYAAQAMPLGRILEAAQAQAATAPDAPILVSVFLPGGVDLLDTLPPLGQFGAYADARPRLKVEDTPELGGTGLGMHPSLTRGLGGGVRGLFEQGKIGLLPGIDYSNPDLSHFHSRHFWETGLVTQKAATGWLGRYLDHTGSADNPLQGVSVDWNLSPVLRSGRAPVAAVASVDDWNLWMPGVWGAAEEQAMATWAELASRPASGTGETSVVASARMAKEVIDRLAPYRQEDDDAPDPLAGTIDYPSGRFAQRLRSLAGMLSAPLGIKLASVSASGDFDTHDNQGEDLERGLAGVSEALAAFQADVEARGLGDRVLTFVWSEFGRRLEQNESDGTDHGAGGLAWVQGTRVRSGVLSDYPDLRRLDREGNLAVTLDFRRVYSSIVEQWLGTDAEAVIPRAGSFGRLELVR